MKLSSLINFENQGRFLLIDNANFHSIDELVKNAMRSKKLVITRIPPMGFLFNPIKDQQSALKWKNISKLIVNNAAYFGLSEDDAVKASTELHSLFIMPFSMILKAINKLIQKLKMISQILAGGLLIKEIE